MCACVYMCAFGKKQLVNVCASVSACLFVCVCVVCGVVCISPCGVYSRTPSVLYVVSKRTSVRRA